MNPKICSFPAACCGVRKRPYNSHSLGMEDAPKRAAGFFNPRHACRLFRKSLVLPGMFLFIACRQGDPAPKPAAARDTTNLAVDGTEVPSLICRDCNCESLRSGCWGLMGRSQCGKEYGYELSRSARKVIKTIRDESARRALAGPENRIYLWKKRRFHIRSRDEHR